MSVGRAALRAVARLLVRAAALRAPADGRDRMRREWDAELERELSTAGGWSAVAAAWGAFADAGAMRDLDRHREGGTTMGEALIHLKGDLSLAARGLRRAPAFTLVAVLTLSVGIGGSAAIYTVLDGVVLDPLPYPDPDRLVRLENVVPGVGADAVWSLSTAQWVYFTDNAETLADVGLYRTGGGNVDTPSGPQRVRLAMVTASMMSLLGTDAHLGRVISEADDESGAPIRVVVSHGFWTRALGADPDVVGTSISFNGTPLEIIGVMEPGPEPPGWSPSMAPDLWMPMRINRASGFSNSHVYPAIARLADGETPESVAAELEWITARLPEVYPNVYSQAFYDQYGFRTVVEPLKADVLGDLSTKIWVIFGGVGLVLLIACANVANLFLVRVESKGRELAIRSALGASRSAIGRYLVAESLTLAAVGGVLALLVGYWGVPALTALAPEELPRVQGVGVGASTVVFAGLLSLAVGLAVAGIPILGGAWPGASMPGGGRSTTAGRERQRLRSSLVVSQMALALTLLVGAGLLVQSLRGLYSTDAGVDADGVLTVSLYMNPHTRPTDQDLWGVYAEILQRVGEVPGVLSVGLGEEIPVEGGYGCTVQGFDDQSVMDRIRQAGMTTCAGQERVTPGYFEALGVPVLAGRAIDEGDHADPTRASVVVSEAFAERFWPGEDPIGKGVGPSGRTIPPFYRVVGVVGDVAKRSDDGQPPLSQDAIAIYYPVVYNPEAERWGGWWAGNMNLVVRTSADEPTSLYPAVRAAIADVDPDIPLANARSMQDVLEGEMADVAFVSLLLGIAAAVALGLAAVGLYGVVAYVVSKRTREIGTRLAIGARPSAVVGRVVGRTLALALAGIVLGIPLAIGASSVGRSVFVGVEPTSPSAYAFAAVVLAAVALAASWLPARRAARVDPVTALRTE